MQPATSIRRDFGEGGTIPLLLGVLLAGAFAIVAASVTSYWGIEGNIFGQGVSAIIVAALDTAWKRQRQTATNAEESARQTNQPSLLRTIAVWLGAFLLSLAVVTGIETTWRSNLSCLIWNQQDQCSEPSIVIALQGLVGPPPPNGNGKNGPTTTPPSQTERVSLRSLSPSPSNAPVPTGTASFEDVPNGVRVTIRTDNLLGGPYNAHIHALQGGSCAISDPPNDFRHSLAPVTSNQSTTVIPNETVANLFSEPSKWISVHGNADAVTLCGELR